MESKAKLFGHPIHPMLVVFPLGLLGSAVVFDALYFIRDNGNFAMVAHWNIVAGIITGLIAAIFGAVDWAAIPSGTRAKSVGLWHGVGNAIVLALFVISWMLRGDVNTFYAPGMLGFGLELLALGLATLTGWLGGELVDQLGVGVNPGANLNAPNALKSMPTPDSTHPSVTASPHRNPRTPTTGA